MAGKTANSQSNSSRYKVPSTPGWCGEAGALCVGGSSTQPRIFLFKRLERDAKLINQRQITIKMMSLSDSSQHEANAPSWQILQANYCPETCYFMVLAKHSQKLSSSTLMNCKSACNREIPKATQSTGPNSCQAWRSITQHYERQGLQKPLERGNFYMKSTELGMTFQLLHLPVYVKRITLITFGFCFVSLQLCSALCSLLLLVGRLVLYRSLISLLPLQQGCKKSFFGSWTVKSKIINLD